MVARVRCVSGAAGVRTVPTPVPTSDLGRFGNGNAEFWGLAASFFPSFPDLLIDKRQTSEEPSIERFDDVSQKLDLMSELDLKAGVALPFLRPVLCMKDTVSRRPVLREPFQSLL